MTTYSIDRWIPNWRELGYSMLDAQTIANVCEIKQSRGDAREWTAILGEVSAAFDAHMRLPAVDDHAYIDTDARDTRKREAFELDQTE